MSNRPNKANYDPKKEKERGKRGRIKEKEGKKGSVTDEVHSHVTPTLGIWRLVGVGGIFCHTARHLGTALIQVWPETAEVEPSKIVE